VVFGSVSFVIAWGFGTEINDGWGRVLAQETRTSVERRAVRDTWESTPATVVGW